MVKKEKFKKEILEQYSDLKEDKVLFLSKKYRISFHEAEDIYQKAFIKALSNLERFRGDSTIKTWLFRIIHNSALDHLRFIKNKKYSEFLNEDGNPIVADMIDQKPNPCEEYSQKELSSCMREKIENAKSRLSPTHKKIFELAFEKKQTYEQIAKYFNCSKGTVMSRVFYARKNFQKFFINQPFIA